MKYHRQIRVEFNHCDPAGIVFYPRYFEMTNSVAENFFRDVAELPYDVLMQSREGVPTARLEVTFKVPSRLGDILDWHLSVQRIGRSSIEIQIAADGSGLRRLTVDLTLVYVDANGRPKPWPQEVRSRIIAFMEAV